jgi:DNA-binding NarL/FixJ family response regulator
VIVDDHPSVRGAVRNLLTSNSIQVCGEAEDGRESIELVKELDPDAVVLDISMPVMGGIEAAQEIHRIAPSTKIVFLTIHDPTAASAAGTLVADAYVHKSEAATDLVPALKRLLDA